MLQPTAEIVQRVWEVDETSIICLSNQALYLSDRGNKKKITKISIDLHNGAPPNQVFRNHKATQMFAHGSVREMRVDPVTLLVEFFPVNGKVFSFGATEAILMDLLQCYQQLYPNSVMSSGSLQNKDQLYIGYLRTGIAFVLLTIMFLWSTAAKANPNNSGRRSGMKDLIESILYSLGPVGTFVICFLVLGGVIGYSVWKYKNPPEAYVLKMLQ